MDSIFRDIRRDTANKTALVSEGNEITFAELYKMADLIASFASQGDVVLLICANDVESIAAYVGFTRRGAVPILAGRSTNELFLDGLKEAYRPAFVFRKTDEKLDGALCELGPYSLLPTGFEIDYAVNPNLALLLSTSGSTGSPKLVRLSRGNLISNTESIIEYLGITPEDRAITTLPMSYTYGLSIINTHLYAGASIVVTDRTLMDREFWSTLKNSRATTFGGVPYTYEMLKKLRFGRMDLPSLRCVTQAGGRLSPELAAEFADICEGMGIGFIVMYGQTEATARMSWLAPEYARAKAGSVGVAIPGGSFFLHGVGGEEITEPRLVGELVYRGENVSMGYAENRFDLCLGDELGGVLETGDLAYFDEDGFYYIAGRKKRFLKMFGNRVNLDEIDAMLRREGCDCASSGADDNLIVYVAGGPPFDVPAFISGRTGLHPSCVKVVEVERIPRSESGKALFGELGEHGA
ncbi:MAG: AMP-binding protein [Synergistaceae bacterium]|nr:AMP-binding protein [Synergistaceae bacterium]